MKPSILLRHGKNCVDRRHRHLVHLSATNNTEAGLDYSPSSPDDASDHAVDFLGGDSKVNSKSHHHVQHRHKYIDDRPIGSMKYPHDQQEATEHRNLDDVVTAVVNKDPTVSTQTPLPIWWPRHKTIASFEAALSRSHPTRY